LFLNKVSLFFYNAGALTKAKVSKMKMMSRSSICVAVLLVNLFVSSTLLPLVAADPIERPVKVGDIFTITSKRGVAVLRGDDSDPARKPASLSLTCEVTELQEHGFKFKVTEGTIEIDGARYTVASAEGKTHARLKLRGGFVGIKGAVVGGEFQLRGIGQLRQGEVVIAMRGPLKIGSIVYRLKFLSVVSKPP